jgi:hypothetical protein
MIKKIIDWLFGKEDNKYIPKETSIEERTKEYEKKYLSIIVTYHDGNISSFKPNEWAIFENSVSKVSKKIRWVHLT